MRSGYSYLNQDVCDVVGTVATHALSRRAASRCTSGLEHRRLPKVRDVTETSVKQSYELVAWADMEIG